MKRTILSLLVYVCSSLWVATAQVREHLPIGLTQEEKTKLEQGLNQHPIFRGNPNAPAGELRTMAEWEEVEYLVVTWDDYYPGILTQIVKAAVEECKVIIITNYKNAVQNTLSNAGVSLSQVQFIERNWDSIWIRDYAGNPVYRNDVDSLFLVDWIYNRPRPNDDAAPDAHASLLNLPIHSTTQGSNDLVNTGGNFMADGFGTGFSSKLILDENKAGNHYGVSVKSEAQVDQIMKAYMGLDRYIKMEVLPYDDIHHIDMHMKLLDEETLLVSEYPQGVADGPQIESNLNYVLNNFNSVFGTPYEVIRIPAPPGTNGSHPDQGAYYRTYANCTFVNKTVLLPTYREEYDSTALRIFKEALPGYKIVPIDIDNSGEVLIASGGAIHCITHTIGVQDPLLISHQRLRDRANNGQDYKVSAFIKHKSGISGAKLYWKTSLNGSYQSINMSLTSTANTWEGFIPQQPGGTTIYYYIEGTAVSGKQQVRPIVAPEGYWKFNVSGNTVGIEDHQNMLNIYPNPAQHRVQVKGLKELNNVILLDLTGRKVQAAVTRLDDMHYNIELNSISPGTYIIQGSQGDRLVQHKLIVR